LWSNCASYGYQKAIDGKTASFSGMSITGFLSDPNRLVNSYMQFDLGALRNDITAVRLVGPISQSYATMPENVSVHLSATTDFKAGTLCDTDISFTEPSQLALIDCPSGVSARYLTVYYNVPNQRLALMEVTPYYDGGCMPALQALLLTTRCGSYPWMHCKYVAITSSHRWHVQVSHHCPHYIPVAGVSVHGADWPILCLLDKQPS
jgi:hypothetical protein